VLGVKLSGPILSELSRTCGHSVSYPSFYLKVDLNFKKISLKSLSYNNISMVTGSLADMIVVIAWSLLIMNKYINT
jgi:hypothetical protein